MASPTFAQVKAILDQTIADWKKVWGRDPDLLGQHETTKFSWNTVDELRSSQALGLALIQPEVVGQNPKQGHLANLVVALQTSGGVNGNGQMPDGGPYRTDAEIQVIIDWIDGGCQP